MIKKQEFENLLKLEPSLAQYDERDIDFLGFCKKCGASVYRVNHIEYDGEEGSSEPFEICGSGKGCENSPDFDWSEDTCTDYGYQFAHKNDKRSKIL